MIIFDVPLGSHPAPPKEAQVGDCFLVDRLIGFRSSLTEDKQYFLEKKLCGITDTYILEETGPRKISSRKSYRHMNGEYSFEEENH